MGEKSRVGTSYGGGICGGVQLVGGDRRGKNWFIVILSTFEIPRFFFFYVRRRPRGWGKNAAACNRALPRVARMGGGTVCNSSGPTSWNRNFTLAQRFIGPWTSWAKSRYDGAVSGAGGDFFVIRSAFFLFFFFGSVIRFMAESAVRSDRFFSHTWVESTAKGNENIGSEKRSSAVACALNAFPVRRRDRFQLAVLICLFVE